MAAEVLAVLVIVKETADTVRPRPNPRVDGLDDPYPLLGGFWVEGMDPKVGYGLRY